MSFQIYCTVLLLNVTYTVYYTLNLQVGTELCLKIAWQSFDCPIVSLNEVFLYDTPLKVTLDHAQ